MANSSKVSVKVDSIKVGTQITWQITTGEIIESLDITFLISVFQSLKDKHLKCYFKKSNTKKQLLVVKQVKHITWMDLRAFKNLEIFS